MRRRKEQRGRSDEEERASRRKEPQSVYPSVNDKKMKKLEKEIEKVAYGRIVDYSVLFAP